jgi:molecular chaperone DnaK
MYKAQQGGGSDAEGAAPKDDVIDADFKEVGGDDKKKSA